MIDRSVKITKLKPDEVQPGDFPAADLARMEYLSLLHPTETPFPAEKLLVVKGSVRVSAALPGEVL